MLPSTGYFKGINCPFYDSGLCERPYCHFRHVKKDSLASTTNEAIESGTILQKLVTAAVQKVLQQTEVSAATSTPQVVDTEDITDVCKVNNAQTKATYNPTPISELNKIGNLETESNDDNGEQRKRHIPVPYTPRKPASLPIKRPVETNGSSKSFVYLPPPAKYTPGASETVHLDPYTPKGSTESNEKYTPGIETELPKYTPKDTQPPSKHNYIPSDRNVSKKKVLEYKPTKVSTKNEMPTVTYQPTPKSLVPCFSSDEDEPEVKKAKLNDLNGLDDLGPEFDILDQILDEEKAQQYCHKNSEELSKIASVSVESSKKQNDDKKVSDKKDSSRRHSNDSSKRHKSSSQKRDDEKLHDDKKSSSSSKKKEKTSSSHSKSEAKSKDSTKKSHKSSSKDKSKGEGKDKSVEKKKESSSKGSEKNSKHSENGPSKSSERHSKHSSKSSSKHDKKTNDKQMKNDKVITKHSKDSKDKKPKTKDSVSIMSDNDGHCLPDDTEFCQKDDDDLIDLSESDEEAIALECKRIFEEYVPTEKTTSNIDETKSNTYIQETNNDNEYVPSKKRISRTADKNIKVLPKVPIKPDYKVSAAQTMANRLAKIKEFHASKNTTETHNKTYSNNNLAVKTDVAKTDVAKSPLNVTNTANSKIRIAHVPYASTLINAKRTIPPQSKLNNQEPSTSSTTIQTVKKGAQRVAHIPNEKFIDRPGVLEPLASKIPANIRSTYLNMMIDECLKIYLSATDAYARAQHEELTTSKKCSTVQIYKNSAVLTVSRLRKELQECNGVKKSGNECSTLQKMTPTISGNISSVGSWSIESKNRRVVDNSHEFMGLKFYNNIKKWVLTEEQLQENGFPRPHMSGEKGRAIIYAQNKKQIPAKGLIRTCCRCKKEYTVDKKGFPVVKEECIYHPNNKYRVRGEVKYQCCSQESSSDGCCIAPCHVYEYVDFDNLKGYIKTMPPEPNVQNYGVYSLDCEMCYTTQGLDLTRVTVIDSNCKVVYETLIKPLHPIIDYNTRYSGITEEHMANVKTTLLEVQATLLSMFTSKTILVGHSLESDFKALKLIHDTVVDTSVLFPHKMGPPYKRALRNLSSEYLKKIIQNSVEGHDSAEDAMVCMELIIYKLREDLKTR